MITKTSLPQIKSRTYLTIIYILILKWTYDIIVSVLYTQQLRLFVTIKMLIKFVSIWIYFIESYEVNKLIAFSLLKIVFKKQIKLWEIRFLGVSKFNFF